MNEKKAVAEQKPQTDEKKVLIFGTNEKSVTTYLKGYATKRGLECIIMSPESMDAFLNKKDPKYKDSIQHKTLKNFVESKENREEALNQAIKLYTILSGEKNIDDHSNEFVFSETDAVHKTTLSHKQFENIANMFEIFNLIQAVDSKKKIYKFTFNKESQRVAVQNGIKSLIRATVSDIARFNANVDADDSLTDDEKAKEKKVLMDSIFAELS